MIVALQAYTPQKVTRAVSCKSQFRMVVAALRMVGVVPDGFVLCAMYAV